MTCTVVWCGQVTVVTHICLCIVLWFSEHALAVCLPFHLGKQSHSLQRQCPHLVLSQPICRLLRPPASPQLTSYSGCSSTGLCPIATSSRAIPEWTHLDSTIFAMLQPPCPLISWSRWPSSMSTGDIWKLLMGINHSYFSELLQPSLVCVPNKQPFVRQGLHCPPPECVSAQVQIRFQYRLVCGTA